MGIARKRKYSTTGQLVLLSSEKFCIDFLKQLLKN